MSVAWRYTTTYLNIGCTLHTVNVNSLNKPYMNWNVHKTHMHGMPRYVFLIIECA